MICLICLPSTAVEYRFGLDKNGPLNPFAHSTVAGYVVNQIRRVVVRIIQLPIATPLVSQRRHLSITTTGSGNGTVIWQAYDPV